MPMPLSPEERFVLDVLRAEKGPVSRSELLERPPPDSLSPCQIVDGMWYLVDRGLARFTPDRQKIVAVL